VRGAADAGCGRGQIRAGERRVVYEECPDDPGHSHRWFGHSSYQDP
jgi:hypothetical protein